ncbi:MAG: class I SAM-dependent methyltransferase [Verrucomicrobiales bacterium]
MAAIDPRQISRLFSSRWHRVYTIAKLRSDPLYDAVYNELKNSMLPLLDLGCGLGILAFYLRERGQKFPIRAVDYDKRKIKAATIAAKTYPGLEFRHADAREGIPEFCGNVAILDTLQFLNANEQRSLLTTAAMSVAQGGKLIIRTGIRDNSLRFKTTRLGDQLARVTFWMKSAPACYPSSGSILDILGKTGLTGTAKPLWGKTPFNNYLLVFRRN